MAWASSGLAWYPADWMAKSSKLAREERFEFTWEGQDEMDPAFGSGWLKLSGKNNLRGSLKFHQGDRSAFMAVRSEGSENTED